MEQLLAKIKLALRITHTKLDEDITDTINACILDLDIAGIHINIGTIDELSVQAIKLYCKWQYDYLNKAEQYEKAYQNLKIAMSLCGDYKGESESV